MHTNLCLSWHINRWETISSDDGFSEGPACGKIIFSFFSVVYLCMKVQLTVANYQNWKSAIFKSSHERKHFHIWSNACRQNNMYVPSGLPLHFTFIRFLIEINNIIMQYSVKIVHVSPYFVYISDITDTCMLLLQ